MTDSKSPKDPFDLGEEKPSDPENFDPFNFGKAQPQQQNSDEPNIKKRVKKLTKQFSIQEAQTQPSINKRVRKLTEQIPQVVKDDPFVFQEEATESTENEDVQNEKSQRLQNLSLVLEKGKGLQETQKISLRKQKSFLCLSNLLIMLLLCLLSTGVYFYLQIKQPKNIQLSDHGKKQETPQKIISESSNIDDLISALSEDEKSAERAKGKLTKIEINEQVVSKLLASVKAKNNVNLQSICQIIFHDNLAGTLHLQKILQGQNADLQLAALRVISVSTQQETFVSSLQKLAIRNPKRFALIVSDIFAHIGPAILPVILPMLKGSFSEIYVGLQTLRKMGNDARFTIPIIIKLLRYKNKKIRLLAKYIIVSLHEKSYIHLVALYKKPKWQKTVMSIFYHGKKQAIPSLEILAKQNDKYSKTIQEIIAKIQSKK